MTVQVDTNSAVATYYIYRWYDAEDVLLYIGLTRTPEIRAASHRSVARWRRWAHRVDNGIPVRCSYDDAQAQERVAIQTENPIFNWEFSDGPRQRITEYLLGRGWSAEEVVDFFPTRLHPKKVRDIRTNAFPVRLSEDESNEIESAAEAAGLGRGPWMRSRLLQAARAELRKRTPKPDPT